MGAMSGDCDPLRAAEQQVFDDEFKHMVEAELALDDVIVKLKAANVPIEPEQRVVVARWLDMFSERLPLPVRLAALHGMLQASADG